MIMFEFVLKVLFVLINKNWASLFSLSLESQIEGNIAQIERKNSFSATSFHLNLVFLRHTILDDRLKQ